MTTTGGPYFLEDKLPWASPLLFGAKRKKKKNSLVWKANPYKMNIKG